MNLQYSVPPERSRQTDNQPPHLSLSTQPRPATAQLDEYSITPSCDRHWSNVIRHGCEWVGERARDVTIDSLALQQFAAAIPLGAVLDAQQWPLPETVLANPSVTINYIFILNALNFGSGHTADWAKSHNQSTFYPIADALARAVHHDNCLSAEWATYVSEQELATLIGPPCRGPLLDRYLEVLHELGSYVYTTFGTFSELLSSIEGPVRSHRLIDLLEQNLPSYRDIAEYHGRSVAFMKRAQILVQDLCLTLPNHDLTAFEDRPLLTAFADNALPQLLRHYGVLRLSPSLGHHIQQGHLLPAGSPQEVELRAATIVAVDRIAELFTELQGQRYCAYHIDPYLWQEARRIDPSETPRHRTKHTTFY